MRTAAYAPRNHNRIYGNNLEMTPVNAHRLLVHDIKLGRAVMS